jgi:uncharacterized RDD family membrane protein YckC
MSEPQPQPGWYYAQGDPVGTQRYWDGGNWVGDPRSQQDTPGAHGDQVRREYGSALERLGANIIDSILVGIPAIVLFFMFRDGGTTTSPGTYLGLVLGAVYSIGFVGLVGATPGKMVFSMEIIRADTGDTPPGFDAAAKRWVLALAGLIPVLGPLINLGIAVACGVLINNDAQNRSVYDHIANTFVVKR